MSSYNKAYSFSVLIFALFFSVSFSDQGSDREVLLSFKANSDPSNSLFSWVDSDPCSGSWLGVTCESSTGRVTGLVLESLGLTGSALPLSRLAELRHLSLKNNSLWSDGGSALDLSAWPNLKHLYLSRNRFAESFPAGVSTLRRLQRLDLSYNRFSGRIPAAELAELPRLLTLRLESNRFEGGLEESDDPSLPSSVSDFNVSGNNLSGEIPEWLRRFNATSFSENDRLCGEPLPYECFNSTVQSRPEEPKQNDRGPSRSVELGIVVLVGVTAAILAATVVFLAFCWRRKLRRARRPRGVEAGKGSKAHAGHGASHAAMVVFEGCGKGVGDVDELLRASAEMLGKGSVGTTYKVAISDGGDPVAVKRVKIGRLGKEIDWWVTQVLGKLRHDNIVSLRAYHRSQTHDLLLLVYDYFPLGSLHHLLHGNRGPGRTPMDWATRLKLASDSARGIAFLHDHNHKMKLFHGHLSSENILVDRLGNASVADTGLHRLLRGTVPPRSSDYTAPEIATLGDAGASASASASAGPRMYTQKCDVYSFGVVLLEIVTGKMAAEEGQASLVGWVRGVARTEWSAWDVLDVEVLRSKETEGEIFALMQVAMLCLAASPKDRPAMSAVYRMIEDIRTKGVRKGESGSVMDDVLDASSSSSSSDEP